MLFNLNQHLEQTELNSQTKPEPIEEETVSIGSPSPPPEQNYNTDNIDIIKTSSIGDSSITTPSFSPPRRTESIPIPNNKFVTPPQSPEPTPVRVSSPVPITYNSPSRKNLKLYPKNVHLKS